MTRKCKCQQCKSHESTIKVLAEHLKNKHGIDKPELDEFLFAFDVPQSCKGLFTVAQRLADEIFPVLWTAIDKKTIHFAQKYYPISKAIQESCELESEIHNFRFEPDREKIWERPGFLVNHPLFGFLWFGLDNPRHNLQFSIFRAQFLLGYTKIRTENIGEIVMRQECCRFARVIGSSGKYASHQHTEKNPEHLKSASRKKSTSNDNDENISSDYFVVLPHLLPQFPTTLLRGEAYANKLRDLLEEYLISGIPNKDRRALLMLADTIEGKIKVRKLKFIRRGNSSGGRREANGGRGSLQCITRVVPSDDEVGIVEIVSELYIENADNVFETGLDVQDYLQVETEAKIPQIGDDDTVANDRLLHIKNANVTSAIAMSNQMLPFHRRQCLSDDIRTLLKSLDAMYADDQDAEQLEVCLLAEMILWLGQTPEQCYSVQISRASISGALSIDQKYKQIRFLTWLPQGHSSAGRSTLTLPLPIRIRRILERLNILCNHELVGRIFSIDLDKLKGKLNFEIRQIEIKTGVSLSISKIEAHLYRTVTQRGAGDKSLAILLTAQVDHRGYVAATYSQWRDSDLNQRYVEAITSIHHTALGEGQCFDSLSKKSKSIQGSSFVPKIANVTKSINYLRMRVIACKRLPPRNLPLFQIHIRYSLYVHMMLAFATGFRSVVMPIPDERLIDFAEGFVYLNDKDGDKAYHGHIVFLPQTCMQQLRHYHEHRKLLANRLILINSQSASELLHDKPISLTKDRRKNQKLFRADPKYIFSFLPDGFRRLIYPGYVNEALKDGAESLSNNSLRHFYRTELTHRGVPDEVIRAAQGHWQIGEESHGKFSGLSPFTCRQFIEQPLSQMMNDVGWKALRSPLCNSK